MNTELIIKYKDEDKDEDIKVYHLPKLMSDEEIEAREGEFFDHFDNVIDHSCDVYYYDEKTKKDTVLLIFRKKAINIDMMKNAIHAFKKEAKKASSIRGKAGGRVVPELVSGNVARIVNPKAFRSKIEYKNGTISNYYVSNKVNSMIVGYFDKEKLVDRHEVLVNGLNGCRTTAFTQNHSAEWKTVVPLFQYSDSLYAKYMPVNYQEQFAHCSMTPKYQIDGTAFSTVTVNYNWQTACHTDKGDYHNGYSVLIVAEEGHYQGGYLGYPQFGVAVDVRQGDFLLINPHLHHANSKIIPVDDSENEFTRLSMVMYYRENIQKCVKENPIPFQEPIAVSKLSNFKLKLKLKLIENETVNDYTSISSSISTSTSTSSSTEEPALSKISIKIKPEIENNQYEIKMVKVKGCLDNQPLTVYIRPETTDIKVIDEVLKSAVYKKPMLNFDVESDETWLDLGGNIGTFSLYALARNCRQVIAYEPEPDNCNLFLKNLTENYTGGWMLNRCAIGCSVNTAESESAVDLYLCKGNYNKYRHTLYHKRGRQSIKVSMVNFKSEMDKWLPDGVKIDIEGSEIDILEYVCADDWKKWQTKKLVFEYSFDIDPSIPRFLKIIAELKKYFKTVYYSKVKDTELEYKYFPAMTIVYCIA